MTENIHEGHRKRLYERLKNEDNLYEYELMEILLFNVYPRRDVNPIAHALLNHFASIKEVLAADVAELCTVEGVGENVALYLKCIGAVVEKANSCDSFGVIKNTAEFRSFIAPRFRGRKAEVFEIYFLDKACRVRRIATYTNDDSEKVTLDMREVFNLIFTHKPYGIYIAHNHVNYKPEPSVADDKLTKEFEVICSICGVQLYDHCIYSDGFETYSYFLADRMAMIQDNYNIGTIINKRFD